MINSRQALYWLAESPLIRRNAILLVQTMNVCNMNQQNQFYSRKFLLKTIKLFYSIHTTCPPAEFKKCFYSIFLNFSQSFLIFLIFSNFLRVTPTGACVSLRRESSGQNPDPFFHPIPWNLSQFRFVNTLKKQKLGNINIHKFDLYIWTHFYDILVTFVKSLNLGKSRIRSMDLDVCLCENFVRLN